MRDFGCHCLVDKIYNIAQVIARLRLLPFELNIWNVLYVSQNGQLYCRYGVIYGSFSILVRQVTWLLMISCIGVFYFYL